MRRATAKNEPTPLGSSWAAPAVVPGGDRGPGKPVACLATTYTFSAELLETELLPRFLGLEFDPAEREPSFLVEREEALEQITAAVLVDQAKVDVRQTTLRWEQVPVRVPRGIQHAKVTVLAWERLVRLIVGSANLTVSGYRHNREVVATLDFFDHEASPPRVVLTDALGFLGHLLRFAAAQQKVLARVRAGIGAVESRLKKWNRIPREFNPREYPRVFFAANLPNPDGGVSRSVLGRVKELWGDRRARDIRVMTPFVGDPGSDHSRVVARLAQLPRLRSAGVSLAVPGVRSDGSPARRIVALPRGFRDAWAAAWEQDADGLDVCVVTPDAAYRGRPVVRPLHAKGLFLSDGAVSLLCCGSSNFTAGGMGVGRANAEANLCYIDRAASDLDGAGLEDRLPVDWEGDRARLVEWPDEPQPSEEDAEPDGCLIPPVFLWATFDPPGGLLRIGLDPGEPLPAAWAIRLPQPEGPVLASQQEYPVMPAGGVLSVKVPAGPEAGQIIMLVVTWLDDGTPCRALLPVQVEDRAGLPPPEALRGLTAEDILACLLAGCSPAEWVDRKEARKTTGPAVSRQDPALDPHRFHDPSGLALYRVRRLGRALTTLGRLLSTIRTPEAIDYHLHRHPLGPVRLAEALVSEACGAAGTPSAMDRARLVFSLLEIVLMIGHAGRGLHRQRQPGEADHRPCFRRAVTLILQRADEVVGRAGADEQATDRGSRGSLRKYRHSVEQEVLQLLGGLQAAEGAACR